MNEGNDVNIRRNLNIQSQSPQTSNSDPSKDIEDAENPTYSKHLSWIRRITLYLTQYLRSFMSYMVPNEDDRNFLYSKKTEWANEKSHLIPMPPIEFHQKNIIPETQIHTAVSSSNRRSPNTEYNIKNLSSKSHTGTNLKTTNDFKNTEVVTVIQDKDIESQTETNIILCDNEEDDSIVVAYLKDKNFDVELDNLLIRRSMSVLEKVPKMETIPEDEQFAAFREPSLTSNVETLPCSKDAELSESSLDVHIPSFPGSPRSLNIGSENSVESLDPYFAEALNFLHEDKDFLIAAETGNYKILEMLIRKGVNIQQMDHLGRNALHLAVCSDSEAAIMLLLKTKIDTNVADNLGMTALSLCLMRRPSYKIANLLFDHGAEISPRSGPVDTGLFLQFVMMCTPTKEDIKILELLVEKGAVVNDPEAPGGRQALHFAAMSNNCQLIRTLVDLGADLSLTNHRNETPLNVAEIFKCKDAYQLLLELEE